MFLGTYRPRLDDKGRLILPAKFREELSSGMVVTRGQERCLYVFSQREFESITEKIDTGQGTLGKLINENRVHDSTDGLIKELRDAIEDTREQAPVTSFIRAALTAF